MPASKAAKITLGAPSGDAGETFIFATFAGIAVLNFQRAASAYSRPSERSEAASHATSNQRWCSSIWINRCPTMPVAPRIPTGIFFCIRSIYDFTTADLRSLVRRSLRQERIVVERTKAFLFRVHAPAPPDNPQACHHGNGQIDAENAGDFASREHAKNRGQRMQFHALSHDSWRDHVVLHQSPRDQEYKNNQPVLIAREQRHADNE